MSLSQWELFTDTSQEPIELAQTDGLVYLKIIDDVEALYFTVVEVTDDSLTLTHLAMGNNLEYKRVK